MGIINRYIKSLPPEARDRIIEAQQWCMAVPVDRDGNRCLVGHVEEWELTDQYIWTGQPTQLQLVQMRMAGAPFVDRRFDKLVKRCGWRKYYDPLPLDYPAVRLVKNAAARANKIASPAVQPETINAAA